MTKTRKKEIQNILGYCSSSLIKNVLNSSLTKEYTDKYIDEVIKELITLSLSLEYEDEDKPHHSKATKSKTANSTKVVELTDVSDITKHLDCVASREEAYNILEDLKKIDLYSVTKHYDIPVRKGATLVELKKAIVEGIIGCKLHHGVLLNTNLGSSPRSGL